MQVLCLQTFVTVYITSFVRFIAVLTDTLFWSSKKFKYTAAVVLCGKVAYVSLVILVPSVKVISALWVYNYECAYDRHILFETISVRHYRIP